MKTLYKCHQIQNVQLCYQTSLIILTLFRNDTSSVLALILNHNHTIINTQIENAQDEDKIL